MHRCDICTSEYTSSWAAAQCEDECQREERNTREFFRSYNPHRKD